MITLEEFKKAEIKIGKIISAEKIEGSEKLLKLMVDFGSEQRQILSGIAKFYDSSVLIGKEALFITNLEPRSMMGLESHGMLLAVDSESGPVLLYPEKEVRPGSNLR